MKMLTATMIFSVFLCACNSNKPKLHKYPVSVQGNFLENCNKTGSISPCACNCVLKHYRISFRYEQFLEIEEEMRRGTLETPVQEWIRKTTVNCIEYSNAVCRDPADSITAPNSTN